MCRSLHLVSLFAFSLSLSLSVAGVRERNENAQIDWALHPISLIMFLPLCHEAIPGEAPFPQLSAAGLRLRLSGGRKEDREYRNGSPNPHGAIPRLSASLGRRNTAVIPK